MRIRRYGDAAWLVDCASLAEAQSRHLALSSSRHDNVSDIVLGARTVLVVCDAARADDVCRWIEATEPTEAHSRADQTIEIAVTYDGPDLADAARAARTDTDSLVHLHLASRWTVAFAGFSPGFSYLVTDHERLHVPRRDSPRPQVPAGSVGLAGPFSGIYPRSSPGGWQIIGHTDACLWDPANDPPALLQPGAVVTFTESR